MLKLFFSGVKSGKRRRKLPVLFEGVSCHLVLKSPLTTDNDIISKTVTTCKYFHPTHLLCLTSCLDKVNIK